MTYWSAHTHSKYSVKDAMTGVGDLVSRAATLGMPALGLTDHGTMAGTYQLYRYAHQAGIMPVPGLEAYVSDNRHTVAKRPMTRHMGLLATTGEGLRNLIGLNNLAHESFKYRPVIDFGDLLAAGRDGRTEGVHVITGCFFGWLPATLFNAGEAAARNLLVTLREAFGDRVYVELQNHRIDEQGHSDADLVSELYSLANAMSFPVVVTNDAHYTYPAQRGMHNALKFMSSWSDSPDDALFPGDGYWLCSSGTMRNRFADDVFDAGVAGLEQMLTGYDLRIPDLDVYSPKVPRSVASGGDPDKMLAAACALSGKQLSVRAKKRLQAELDVIRTTGFATYMLLVASICRFMRDKGIIFNARGSASGSLVCYLLGITQVDPLKYDLLFERFLAVDRKTPPDIDLDIQHDRRKEVVDWLGSEYSCVQIGTWTELKLGDDGFSGSVAVHWNSAARKTGRTGQPPMELLRDLSALGTYTSTGTHPAGLLVTESAADRATIPMQWIASSKTMVTALDMNDLETAGYTKVDLLGLRTLSAVANTASEVGVDLDEVKLNDPKVFSRIKSGDLAGAFQLSGWTAAKGCRQMKPQSFRELVHVMALFRPAAMGSHATEEYLENRRRGTSGDHDLPEVVKAWLSETRGVLLFQEQLIGVLRDIGVGPELLTRVLKAVKASNANVGDAQAVMDSAVGLVEPMAREAGFTDTDMAWLANAMRSYAEYGFNKAHAVAYARVAYLSVWLMVHYPAHFYANMITAYAGRSDYVAQLVGSASMRGVVFVSPHVNESKLTTAVSNDSMVVYALTEINGVGQLASEEIVSKQPYTSVADLASRCNSRKVTGANVFLSGAGPKEAGGVITALYTAGALVGLPEHEPGDTKKEN